MKLSTMLSATLLFAVFTPAPFTAADDSRPCTASDNTGGFGGQAVACVFRCSDGWTTFVETQNSDPQQNVRVEGTVECGGADAWCQGTRSYCWSESSLAAIGDPVWGTATGACEGRSWEYFDSGLKVTCGNYNGTSSSTTCELDCYTVSASTSSPNTLTTVTVAWSAGIASAVTCGNYGCSPLHPTCDIEHDEFGEYMRCSVEFAVMIG